LAVAVRPTGERFAAPVFLFAPVLLFAPRLLLPRALPVLLVAMADPLPEKLPALLSSDPLGATVTEV
jgi:hypothetical protein